MSESDRYFPVSDPKAVSDAFEAYVQLCEFVLVSVFGKTPSEGVEFNAWLHDFAGDDRQKLYLLHIEPRNVAEDYSHQPQVVLRPMAHQGITTEKSDSLNPDQRGTVTIVVKTLLAPKSENEAAEDKADREDKSAADWWTHNIEHQLPPMFPLRP